MMTSTQIQRAAELVELGLYDETQFRLDLVQDLLFTPELEEALRQKGFHEWQVEHDKTGQRWHDLTHQMSEVYRTFSIQTVTINIDPIGQIESHQLVESKESPEGFYQIDPALIESDDELPSFFVKVKLVGTVIRSKSLIVKIRPDWTVDPKKLAEWQETLIG